MKKLLLLSFTFGVMAFGFSNCKKDKKDSCEAASAKISSTTNAYAADQSTANCLAMKAAYTEFLNSNCADGLTAEERTNYEMTLEAFDCE